MHTIIDGTARARSRPPYPIPNNIEAAARLLWSLQLFRVRIGRAKSPVPYIHPLELNDIEWQRLWALYGFREGKVKPKRGSMNKAITDISKRIVDRFPKLKSLRLRRPLHLIIKRNK